jgi:hypothetical protein
MWRCATISNSAPLVSQRLWSVSASGQFNNTPAGFRKLSKWLTHKGAGEVWACLESTGRSGDALAA